MNKCETCGKFKPWSELKGHFTPDNEFGPEESWYECHACIQAGIAAARTVQVDTHERVCPLCGTGQDNAEPISFEEALTFGAVVAMLTRPGPGYDKAREEYTAALNKLMESLQTEPDKD